MNNAAPAELALFIIASLVIFAGLARLALHFFLHVNVAEKPVHGVDRVDERQRKRLQFEGNRDATLAGIQKREQLRQTHPPKGIVLVPPSVVLLVENMDSCCSARVPMHCPTPISAIW